jgi:3-oxoacyl-[acyl-carrier-protein] synthase-3
MLCKKLKVAPEKMPLCLDRFGNPSAPAIPMVMCDAYGESNEDKVLNFLMCGFGVGLSWGVCSAKVNVKDILPIIETDEIFEEGIINSPEDFFKEAE